MKRYCNEEYFHRLAEYRIENEERKSGSWIDLTTNSEGKSRTNSVTGENLTQVIITV